MAGAATDTLHDRLLEGIAALVKSLRLAGDPAAGVGDVAGRAFAEEQDANVSYPCVIVTARGLPEATPNDLANTEQQGVTYPAAVLICDVPQGTLAQAAPVYLNWRRLLLRALHERWNGAVPPTAKPPLLPDCPECAFTLARPLDVYGEKPGQEIHGHANVVGGLVVECHCAEARAD